MEGMTEGLADLGPDGSTPSPRPPLALARPALACVPPRWARGPHGQTLAGRFLPFRGPTPPWQRLEVDLGDGDALVIRVADGPVAKDPAQGAPPVVVLLHGVGGSADSNYMVRMASRLHGLGFAVASVNHRGAGEGRGRATRPYHAGAVGDLSAVFGALRGRFPGRRLVALGFSLSANMLLLALGRGDAGTVLPDAALAVNPPAHLERASLRLLKGFNRVYDLRFVRLLRADVAARGGYDLSGVRSLRDFDGRYTAPAAGFRDRDDYYARAACGPHLQGIRVPTVILSSLDDPFATAADLRDLPRSPWVHLHVEAHGGHMGYVSANLPDRRWMDYAILHYLDGLLGLPA